MVVFEVGNLGKKLGIVGIGVEVASATCATSVGSSGSGVAVGVGSTGSGVAVGSGVSVESLESMTSLHDVCPGWS